jgi:uncharacterized membrane protein
MTNGDRVSDVLAVRARRLVEWLNPITGSPSAALETSALLDAFGPSLMPRTSRLQGVAAGLGVLAARGVGRAVDAGLRRVQPPDAGLGRHLAVRGAACAVGAAVGALSLHEDERLPRAGLRSVGQMLTSAAVGGALYDSGMWLRARYPAQRAVRPLLVTALAVAGVAARAGRQLVARQAVIERWPVEQRNTLPAAIGVATVTEVVGSGLTRGFVTSRRAINGYLGSGWSKRVLAGVANAGLWTVGASALYNAGVAAIGRANEQVEGGYALPPSSPLLSGGPGSVSPFDDLGQQGRRYVTDVVTPEVISEVLGEPAVAHPIRTYVGFNSEPIYASGRAELALTELERTGAFDRSYLLLVNPTGTGWVDQTMIEAAELFARGDIATCCIQYGRFPSFLALQKVALGRGQFRLLLWGITQRLRERPPERRPKVLVFGESLGAWASSDVVMFAGLDGFDHYGIDKALWVGLPGLAKWSRNGMARGANALVPPGTVGVFDRHEQLATLPPEQRDRLRAVILSHDNDPIAQLSPDLLVARPEWLGDERGRGVPEGMTWSPIVTLFQVLIDAANAMVTMPGDFRSFGHDYRADMARFVLDGLGLPPASDAQIASVERFLRDLESERAARITTESAEAAPAPPAERDAAALLAGVPLRQRRTGGARWLRGLSRRAGDEQDPAGL